MEETYSIQLSKVIEKFNLETLYLPNLPQNIHIKCSRVNRPGLQIAAGFFDYYERERIQIIGLMENQYLTTLDAAERSARLEAL